MGFIEKKASKFLQKSIYHFIIISIILLILLSCAYSKFDGKELDISSIILAFIFLFILFAWLKISGWLDFLLSQMDKFSYSWYNYRKYARGGEGERITKRELEFSLGKKYHIFNDITLPDRMANIDHLVVCSNGIFAIETKNPTKILKFSPAGIFYFDEERWKRVQKDPIKQAKQNAIRVRNYIYQNLGKEVFVQPLIAIVDKEKCIREGQSEVPILFLNEITDFIINNKKWHLKDNEINEIINCFNAKQRG